jgi:hypothetical protein
LAYRAADLPEWREKIFGIAIARCHECRYKYSTATEAGQMRTKKKESKMLQWIGVAIAVIGLIYGGVKDIQNGNLKIPYYTTNNQTMQAKPQTQRFAYQYCLMCYDPNIEKVFYQHADGSWRDYPPQQQKIPIYN